MGCDIHLHVEKKIDGKWTPILGVNEPEVEYLENTIADIKERGDKVDYWERRLEEERNGTANFIYDGRHYLLFSLLAGVRNEYDLKPICEPKGLPIDVSDEVKANSDELGIDGHSHTWLTARELVEFDWSQTVEQEGWVSEKEYKVFKEKVRPESWSGGVGGGRVRHVSNTEMNRILKNGYPWENDDSFYTLVKWTLPYSEIVGSFYTWSIPKMTELAGDDLESVRIVFWFDN
ncbi:hypothetical protein [Paenibacillus larvae]|uniref:Uncharacterized protein n=1 Tax=Paenibacillus larvae subsp. larvae TaxID=147375 RepID=A0A2L1U4X4_9BACL|nr:hypothetical protein [Paenibacillus larvae]AVF27972.1 hypothetical protein ERICIII_03868 [Paenibacillus larvae subsp. larvae]MCY9502596.1 hypothetical protein [Paenibacillus larvae]MCY9748150.1 hypothetical protein [Paenibacillus larvae]MCY9751274.1 hypothetical protein [Paenibacillus larvae]MDR5608184.1 hypothetical protein [Paenibacillus larvae]